MRRKKINTVPIICGQTEIEWLSMRCGRMARAISLIGPISRSGNANPFQALIHAITGQQISGRAHETVWQRVNALASPFTPEKVLKIDVASLRACGLSARKTEYVNAIARAFASGMIKEQSLASMPDAELARNLRQLRGVGPWTVEMLQIFTFRRKDIMSFGDLGIRKGLQRLHNLEIIDQQKFEYFKSLYSPCGTAASLYLWEVAAMKNCPPPGLRNKAP